MITITFLTGDGLTGGQTKVQHKAVDLGTVRSITLSPDMTHVVVRVQMTREATPELTENARFWVVRPRFTGSNVSGLETLLSGAYIELDPGAPGAAPQRDFTGLEEPPAVRSDEPGRTFELKTDRVGSFSTGSPVFFHDIDVGEVLRYDVGPQGEGITMHIFIRAPYDKFVHDGSRFWNASGVSIESGRAGRARAVAKPDRRPVRRHRVRYGSPRVAPPLCAKTDASFTLFKDEDTADTQSYSTRFPYLIYFDGSVRGLSPGAALEFQGIQIGVVTSVDLELDPIRGTSRVAVRVEVQPERVLSQRRFPNATAYGAARALVAHGMRAQLITGQSADRPAGRLAGLCSRCAAGHGHASGRHHGAAQRQRRTGQHHRRPQPDRRQAQPAAARADRAKPQRHAAIGARHRLRARASPDPAIHGQPPWSA